MHNRITLTCKALLSLIGVGVFQALQEASYNASWRVPDGRARSGDGRLAVRSYGPKGQRVAAPNPVTIIDPLRLL